MYNVCNCNYIQNTLFHLIFTLFFFLFSLCRICKDRLHNYTGIIIKIFRKRKIECDNLNYVLLK